MDLPEDPDNNWLSFVGIHYCNAMKRLFCVRGVHRLNKNKPEIVSLVSKLWTQRPALVEMANKEYGKEHHGAGTHIFMTDFGSTVIPRSKMLAIDKYTAREAES